MKAREWMTTDVCTCRPEASMNDAAFQMWNKDCGVLPVVDAGGKLVGIVTDRDLCMAACLRGKSLKEMRVDEVMSRKVHACGPDDAVEDVVRQMGDHQVRRIPVVDANRRLLGILSMNDLVRNLMAVGDPRVHSALAMRIVEAQASVCESRTGQPLEIVPPRTPPSPRARPVPVG